MLTIKQEYIAGKCQCTATPKLAEEAFLQADIHNWEALCLLNGDASIYYSNTYVGNFNIDTRWLSDTFRILFDYTVIYPKDKRIVGVQL